MDENEDGKTMESMKRWGIEDKERREKRKREREWEC
jgi:hypothetical protein